ncbi:hypothetical protein YC2023_033958 [Brassica napus]
MPKTYMKYPNIPNIHKSFQVLWVPDRVSNRTQTGTEILGPKDIDYILAHDSDPNWTYIFGLVSDLVFHVRQTVESNSKNHPSDDMWLQKEVVMEWKGFAGEIVARECGERRKEREIAGEEEERNGEEDAV